VRGIEANISRDELGAAANTLRLGESCCGVVYEFEGNVKSADPVPQSRDGMGSTQSHAKATSTAPA